MAKIMICDDAAFMRMMIKDILTKNGMRSLRRLRMEQLQLRSTRMQSRIWF